MLRREHRWRRSAIPQHDPEGEGQEAQDLARYLCRSKDDDLPWKLPAPPESAQLLTVLRRLDCVLEPTRGKVLSAYAKLAPVHRTEGTIVATMARFISPAE